jgi:hypothetical protein
MTMLQTTTTAPAPVRKRMTVPAVPTIEQWLFANPGPHTVADVKAALPSYGWSTISNGLAWLCEQRKAFRRGVPHTKSGITYEAMVPYFQGYRAAP